ncbi:hypothetical protein EUX98_g9072 [Antrodiella citrinella]|uniref:Uncharacterized protein n=1 Tax=Antrodiella citrinella TaxID=2447956 RepID=A0A4S4LYZ3_9APHY|nr:hypothetical protein EUX98_g9072 [Antrodiella citrinella]
MSAPTTSDEPLERAARNRKPTAKAAASAEEGLKKRRKPAAQPDHSKTRENSDLVSAVKKGTKKKKTEKLPIIEDDILQEGSAANSGAKKQQVDKPPVVEDAVLQEGPSANPAGGRTRATDRAQPEEAENDGLARDDEVFMGVGSSADGPLAEVNTKALRIMEAIVASTKVSPLPHVCIPLNVQSIETGIRWVPYPYGQSIETGIQCHPCVDTTGQAASNANVDGEENKNEDPPGSGASVPAEESPSGTAVHIPHVATPPVSVPLTDSDEEGSHGSDDFAVADKRRRTHYSEGGQEMVDPVSSDEDDDLAHDVDAESEYEEDSKKKSSKMSRTARGKQKATEVVPRKHKKDRAKKKKSTKPGTDEENITAAEDEPKPSPSFVTGETHFLDEMRDLVSNNIHILDYDPPSARPGPLPMDGQKKIIELGDLIAKALAIYSREYRKPMEKLAKYLGFGTSGLSSGSRKNDFNDYQKAYAADPDKAMRPGEDQTDVNRRCAAEWRDQLDALGMEGGGSFDEYFANVKAGIEERLGKDDKTYWKPEKVDGRNKGFAKEFSKMYFGNSADVAEIMSVNNHIMPNVSLYLSMMISRMKLKASGWIPDEPLPPYSDYFPVPDAGVVDPFSIARQPVAGPSKQPGAKGGRVAKGVTGRKGFQKRDDSSTIYVERARELLSKMVADPPVLNFPGRDFLEWGTKRSIRVTNVPLKSLNTWVPGPEYDYRTHPVGPMGPGLGWQFEYFTEEEQAYEIDSDAYGQIPLVVDEVGNVLYRVWDSQRHKKQLKQLEDKRTHVQVNHCQSYNVHVHVLSVARQALGQMMSTQWQDHHR